MQPIGMGFVDLLVLLVQICPRIWGNVPYYCGHYNKVRILIIFSMFQFCAVEYFISLWCKRR